MRLVKPSNRYKSEYLRALQELVGTPEFILLKEFEGEQFEKYLTETKNASKGNTSGTPRSEFWLINNGKYIGKIQIRHSIAGKYPNIRSHVYYEIRPSMQKRGYGTKILSLGIKKAKAMSLRELIIVCKEENTASKKIIEKNGGVLLKKEKTPEGVFLKYIIKLV